MALFKTQYLASCVQIIEPQVLRSTFLYYWTPICSFSRYTLAEQIRGVNHPTFTIDWCHRTCRIYMHKRVIERARKCENLLSERCSRNYTPRELTSSKSHETALNFGIQLSLPQNPISQLKKPISYTPAPTIRPHHPAPVYSKCINIKTKLRITLSSSTSVRISRSLSLIHFSLSFRFSPHSSPNVKHASKVCSLIYLLQQSIYVYLYSGKLELAIWNAVLAAFHYSSATARAHIYIYTSYTQLESCLYARGSFGISVISTRRR